MNAPVLLAVAHGTRSRLGQQQIRGLVDRIARRNPGIDVRLAYVDVQEPRVDIAIPHRDTIVVPLLLAAGHHVRVDIARAARAKGAVVAAPLGPDPILTSIMKNAIKSGMRDMAEGPPTEAPRVGVDRDEVRVGAGCGAPRVGAEGEAPRVGAEGEPPRVGADGKAPWVGAEGEPPRVGVDREAPWVGVDREAVRVGVGNEAVRVGDGREEAAGSVAGQGGVVGVGPRLGAEGAVVVLAAAGSSDPGWRAQVEGVARELGARVGYTSGGGPRVRDVVEEVRSGGVGRVVVAAYLLADGLFYRSLHSVGADAVTPPLCADSRVEELVVERYRRSLTTVAGVL